MIPSPLDGMFFTAEISLIEMRNPVSLGWFFFHLLISSRQDGLKWMLRRISKAFKQSSSHSKLK